MVRIKVIEKENVVICDCKLLDKTGKSFQLVIDKQTYELLNEPELTYDDINCSVAYSCIYNLLVDGNPLPSETYSEWG